VVVLEVTLGVGATVVELQPHIPAAHPAVAKKLFSMCTPEVLSRLDGGGPYMTTLVHLLSSFRPRC